MGLIGYLAVASAWDAQGLDAFDGVQSSIQEKRPHPFSRFHIVTKFS